MLDLFPDTPSVPLFRTFSYSKHYVRLVLMQAILFRAAMIYDKAKFYIIPGISCNFMSRYDDMS